MALVALVLTTLGVTTVYYNLFQQQVRRDLRVTAEMLSASAVFEDPQAIPKLPAGDLRVTWIDGDGRVLYDNEADPQGLPNHADRPEIQMALSEGTGETVRKSDTLNMNTFYYAKRLPGGTVLRLAAEARSMGSVFLAAAPVLLGIILVIFLGCLLLSHLLTAQLIAPIEEMAAHLDEPGRRPAYRELEPFAHEIRAQHEKILAAAKSRQDFTANVSHELKTPLTAISGYAELVENKMVDEEQTVRFAHEIRKNAENTTLSHHINQAMKARGLMKKDIDYVVKDGEIIIVDEFTGRLMYGRRYNEGLHQAIEAKEGVNVASESKTLATITFQNFFRLYDKLSGMTGTALTEEEEFGAIYSLDVVEIPTNKPVIRVDHTDVVYKTEAGKYRAIVEQVKQCHAKGQPVLVGTISIEKSELLSKMLKREGIPHNVLNAKLSFIKHS